jgi:hypothetical protein
VFIQGQDSRRVEAGSSCRNAVGIWFVDKTDSLCDWCIDWLGPEEEEAFLAPFFDKAKEGGILVVGEIKNALDQRLGRNVALVSAYNLLHRHDWRKLAPDKRHPKSDPEAQEVWKKNFQTLFPKSGKPGRAKGRSG